MCTRQEVEEVIEQKVPEIVKREMENFRDEMIIEMKKEDDKNFQSLAKLVHTPSPETVSRLSDVEEYIKNHKDLNKRITGWLAGSILAFLGMGFSIVWWGATVSTTLDQNYEAIKALTTNALIKQDASVLQAQLDGVNKRLDLCERK
jgi:hypothetical protein